MLLVFHSPGFQNHLPAFVPMDYDAIIIGAGMSGLAAGIRMAMFGRRVCILERHYAYGGLNSYYKLNGREYDVGLHALTNFVPAGVRHTPLPRVLRQLRIPREAFQLCEQHGSEIRFPACRLRFTNDIACLTEEIAANFPGDVDGFLRVAELTREVGYDHQSVAAGQSSRAVLGEHLKSPLLIEMLLCPLMYYGSPTPHDMDFAGFSILFQSVYGEGFARSRGGVRTIIKSLVKRFRAEGGELRMRCGVQSINVEGEVVASVTLDDGSPLTATRVFSSIGSRETLAICSDQPAGDVRRQAESAAADERRLTFVESISILDRKPADIDLGATIIFFNDGEQFRYAAPEEGLIDSASGVLCCPNNYDDHDDLADGIVRLTSLAHYRRWAGLDETAYLAAKQAAYDASCKRVTRLAPDFRPFVTDRDIFTPRTIERFTGHVGGAVYGDPDKVRDGRTHLQNLYLCGTDQGLLGIIGAMLSGVLMANQYGLDAG